MVSGYLLTGSCLVASSPELPAVSQEKEKIQWLNVLLLGIDARPDESIGRTDSIILASLEPRSGQVRLLSIPRDTRVNIPGRGWNKINTACVYGGPELTMEVVSELLGTPIEYYALVDFNGFAALIDKLGGVTIDVEQDMFLPDDEYSSLGINLRKGKQRLNGKQALQYVRYRSYLRGDLDRTLHQQKFLTALAQETLRLGTIPKLPSLLPELLRNVETNLNAGDLYQLAAGLGKINNLNISTQTLPGHSVYINGGSYWAVDPARARLVLARLQNGETMEVVEKEPVDPEVIGATSYQTAPKSSKDDETAEDEEAKADQDKNQTAPSSGDKNSQKPPDSSDKPSPDDKTAPSDRDSTDEKKPADKGTSGTDNDRKTRPRPSGRDSTSSG